jgi:hypothetical protein
VAGKKHLFLVDSGATVSIYDPALPVGKAIGTAEVDSPGGPVTLSKHVPPNARLGEMSLHDKGGGFVLAFDCSKQRPVFGEPCFGVIGMDFLNQHVVQIDFDAGEFRFLKKADNDCGQAHRMEFQIGMHFQPLVQLPMPDVGETWFAVDTGLCCTRSAGFEKELYDKLVKKQQLEEAGTVRSATAAGIMPAGIARRKALTFGGFTITNLVVGASPNNVLGLSFLARFLVTLDFPNNKLYLKKGKGFASPDLLDLSGLSVLRVDGKTVVHSVRDETSAAVKGIKAKDQLLRVGKTPVEKMTMLQLRRLLGTPSPALEIALRRGDEERTVTLQLE